MKIRLLFLSMVLGLAACSDDDEPNTNTIGNPFIPIEEGPDPDPDPDPDPPIVPPREDTTLPAQFTGGASLDQSEYHYHCNSDDGSPVAFPAFYDDGTGRLFNEEGDDPATWTSSGNNAFLDVPALNGVIDFNNVTFITAFSFTSNIGVAGEFATCRAFADVTEIPLEGAPAGTSSNDSLINGATLDTGTTAWECQGDAFANDVGLLAFFEDSSGILGAGDDGQASLTTWSIDDSNNVQLTGDGFDPVTLESVSVSGNQLSFANAVQGDSVLGSADCGLVEASFSLNKTSASRLHALIGRTTR